MVPSNTKKKQFALGVVLVTAVTMAGLQSAGAGPRESGPAYRGSGNCGECGGYGYQGQQLTDEKTAAARDAFLKETADLRKQIAVKKAEKYALMTNDNPDANRIAQLTGELFDLREQLQAKAKEKGILNFGSGFGPGRGCGGPGPGGL